MLLFLVRHGETVHNVAGVYAGVLDSALTNHGVLQANRLAKYLAERVKISHILSSDLQRAFKTAEAIRIAQSSPPPETVKVVALREQDFGFYEGKAFYERPRDSNKSGKDAHADAHRNEPGFKDVESKGSMDARTDIFVNEHLVPLFDLADDDSVVVVAHGIILNHLWRSLLRRFPRKSVSIVPELVQADQGQTLEYLGGWSNTGYLELEIRENTVPSIQSDTPSKDVVPDIAAIADGVIEEQTSVKANPPATDLLNKTLVLKTTNGQEHLRGLKKTKGGIGSQKHDENQKTIESFFKKRKLG